jgi:hypothetical protein
LKGKTKVRVILCVAIDRLCLCQVADQNGRSYILSSQVISAEKVVEDHGRWLAFSLKKFNGKLLKNVSDVIFSTTLIPYQPMQVFCLRDDHFIQAAIFELENIMGAKVSQYKFGFYKTSENYNTGAFLILKTRLEEILNIFKNAGIKNARILPAPVMFIDEAKYLSTQSNHVFLNIDRGILSMVLRKKEEIYSSLLPIKLEELAEKITPIVGKKVNEDEVCRIIQEARNKDNNSPLHQVLDEFFDEVCLSVEKKVKAYFGEDQTLTFVIGGRQDSAYNISQRLQKTGNVLSYNEFFKQRISSVTDGEALRILDPFLPGILAAATSDKKRFKQVVNLNLKTDTFILKEQKPSFLLYEKFVAGLVCVLALCFYLSRDLNCQYLEEEGRNKGLAVKQEKLTRIAKRIAEINAHIKEQKKILGDVLVYIEQNRSWCEFFNALQEFLSEVGNIYLNSFLWSVQTEKGGGGTTSQSQSTTTPLSDEDGSKTDESKTVVSSLSSSIYITGEMFIGDVEITQEVKQDFNHKFNRMFEKIRRLPACGELVDIKVNAPENCKITFRFIIHLSPESKIIAQ